MEHKRFYNAITSLVLMVFAATAFAADANNAGKGNDQAQANRPEMVDVIVTYKAMPDQAEAARVKGLGGKTYRSYGRLPVHKPRRGKRT